MLADEFSPEAQKPEDELWIAVRVESETAQLQLAERLMAEGCQVVTLSRAEPDWNDIEGRG